jgi:signal transduction protein with GAF and PtsI domain
MKSQPSTRFTLKKFQSIVRAVSTYTQLDLLVTHLVQDICGEFNMKACSILLFDDRENQLFRMGSFGLSDEYLTKGPVFVDDKCNSFIKGEPVLIKDLQSDPRVQYPDAAKKEALVSLLAIPVKCRNYTIGEMRIYSNRLIEFHEEDIALFLILGQFLGLVIDNQGLRNFIISVRSSMQDLPLRILHGP